MSQKRKLHDSNSQKRPESRAAKFNVHIIKKLQAAIDRDPEIDLTTQIPTNYTSRLTKFRTSPNVTPSKYQGHNICSYIDGYLLAEKSSRPRGTKHPSEEDILDLLSPSDTVHILFPLSQDVLELLGYAPQIPEPLPKNLSRRLFDLLQTSEVLWKGPFADHKMVVKCAADIVVKMVQHIDDYTEYTTLQYLEQHKPDCPAPRPLGCMKMGRITLIFLTYIPSTTLGEVWNKLDSDQKVSVRDQLDAILTSIRSLPYVDGHPLGGVAGEGCKDIRRHLRQSDKPIKTLVEFEDFLFSSPRPGGLVFVELLRQLSPCLPSPANIVFTHGDLRPDNITVEMGDHDQCLITGIIDWEYSGFYPDYYEAVRSTNCLAPYDDDDWFLYLPECI